MVKKNVRKQLIISRKFQTKYMFILLGTFLSAALVFGMSIYVTILEILKKRMPSIDEQKFLSDLFFGEVNNYLLVVGLLFILLVILVSVVISHKIAGPEYRLSRVMESVAKGDFTSPTKLRRRDELQELANKVGDANKNLSGMIKKQKNLISELVKDFDELKEMAGKASARKISSMAHSVSKKVKALEKDFKKYKILND
jgi:methyl-accepting chemotaxis protein